MELRPVPSDYERLFERNPLAAEQLKAIVLERMHADLQREHSQLVLEYQAIVKEAEDGGQRAKQADLGAGNVGNPG